MAAAAEGRAGEISSISVDKLQDQLMKCLEEEDYAGAAVVKDNIRAVVSAEPARPHHVSKGVGERLGR